MHRSQCRKCEQHRIAGLNRISQIDPHAGSRYAYFGMMKN
jgi:hypothetical protein